MLKFHSTQSDYLPLANMPIWALSKTDPSKHDPEIGVMYDIMLESGFKIQGYADEIENNDDSSLVNEHYAEREFNKIVSEFFFSPKPQSLNDILDFVHIIDFGGFCTVCIEGQGATILNDADTSKIESKYVSVLQTNMRNTTVDLIIKNPLFLQHDFDIDLETAYQYAINQNKAYVKHGNNLLMPFKQWKESRDFFIELTK